MLEIKGLSLNISPSFSLKDISLSVQEFQCHVIIGPTGSGKTLLLETIMGYKRPDRGAVLLYGKEITSAPVEKRGLSYVPQDLALFPHLSVEKNIFYGLKIKGRQSAEDRKIAEEVIDLLGIRPLLKRSTKFLSGGERQRVAFARALAPANPFLLLDEPLSALHEGMRKELWYLLKELQQKYRFTILMVTHSLDEAFFLGDRASVMIDGAIRQSGPKREIYRRPKTLDVARFFGIRNLFEAEVIDSRGGRLSLLCKEPGMTFEIHLPAENHSMKGTRLFLGIRPENIKVSSPGIRTGKEDIHLEGKIVNLIEKGPSHTLLFMPERSCRAVEIEMEDRPFQTLSPGIGQDYSISLAVEDIFLVA